MPPTGSTLHSCAACGAELPAGAESWCPSCGAALSRDGDGWEISSALPVTAGPPESGAEPLPGAGRRWPIAVCRNFLRRLTARPRLLAAGVVACVVILAGIGTGAFLLINRGGTDELYPVLVDGKTGFINRDGEMVLEPRQMDGLAFFSEGLAMVSVDGKTGFIDTTGDYAIQPQYEGASNFSEGLAAVWQGGQASYIDKSGRFVIQIPGMAECGDFSEGLASFGVYDNDRYTYGYLDRHGNVVISPRFAIVGPFSEGLAAVAIEDGSGYFVWGYVDKSGTWVIQPTLGAADAFSEGLAAASKAGLSEWGYIDRTGAWVIEPTFPIAQPFSEGLASVEPPTYSDNSEGFGFIDKSGAMVIRPAFAIAGSFSEGLAAAARLDESGDLAWGYVDKTGKWIVEPQYQQAGPFQPGGLAMVVRSGGPPLGLEFPALSVHFKNWGNLDGYGPIRLAPTDMAYIDKTGRVVWETPLE